MQINKLLGKLTPAHPDIFPVLEIIREKYNLPEIAPGDYTLVEILGAEDQIDLEAMYHDIETELREILNCYPPKQKVFTNCF